MMKNSGIILFLAAFAFFSCKKDETATPVATGLDTSIATEDASFEVSSNEWMDDIDEAADFSSESGGRILVKKRGGRFGECVTPTKDETTKTTTLVFDGKCTGKDGRVRSGKIIITQTGEKDKVGFIRTVTLEDFIIDGVTIEGTRTLTYKSGSATKKVFETALIKGKITFDDKTFATRVSTRTRTVSFDADGKKIQVEYYGISSGKNNELLDYAHKIDVATPVVTKESCREQKIFSPVSGKVSIKIGEEEEKVIDFGSGDCDNKATVTQGSESKEITLDPKQKRRKNKRGAK